MKTRTIYGALDRVYRGVDWVIPPKRKRQHDTFERELLRRMDYYDTLVNPVPPYTTFERIGQHMAGLSDAIKADDSPKYADRDLAKLRARKWKRVNDPRKDDTRK